jgi:NAD(P)-dependent dehydrogenase (short-subunit alcohol dehydrogenase family)
VISYGLEGRHALVTGGTSGIGRAIVERLHREGMTVAFTGRDEVRGSEVAQATGATFLRCDHLDRAASDRTVADALALAGGRLDLLVANAGIIYGGPIEATPDRAFLQLVEVNLTALFRVSRACFEPLKAEGGGSMVHIASDTGIRGIPAIAAYSVTKAGAVAVSELFAYEGAPRGVRSNAVCPGDVLPGVQATPAGHEDHAESPEGWTPPPSGRFGTGEDVANLVAWLASDEAEHVNGATLRVDGAAGAVFRA